MAVFDLLIDDVVDPGIDFLEDEGDAIDVEQQQDFNPLLEDIKVFVISCVFDDAEGVVPSGVVVDLLAFGFDEIGLLLLIGQELLLFVEVLAPATVGYPVIALFCLQDLIYDFYILFAEFIGFRLVVVGEFDPEVEG